MACPDLVYQIKNLINQYEASASNQNQPMSCPQTTEPCVTCCMVCPPPIMAPTVPQPVKPLSLPCPEPINQAPPEMTPEQAERWRYENFYNNYNVDWHSQSNKKDQCKCPDQAEVKIKKRCCVEKNNKEEEDKGCPTGFKPCTMKLDPPKDCHPCGVWQAQIQPCPPKPKKKSLKYDPGVCTRPGCKHWKPADGDCKYDDPCKAHCFNHPQGMKPKKRDNASAGC